MNFRQVFPVSLALLTLTLAGGCTKRAASPITSLKVDGKLTVDGKPFGPALLTFNPKVKSLPGIEARVKSDGTFEVINFPKSNNQPSGEYEVTLSDNPEEMQMTGVPPVKPLKIELRPVDGQKMALNVKFKSKRGKKRIGGPDPNTGSSAKKGLGGI